jgi:hypothetical protein
MCGVCAHVVHCQVRLEGKFEDDSFYKLADEFGILVLHGV